MLKKKMQSLVREKNLAQQKFEVVSDSSASRVLGGLIKDCDKLVKCGTFEGNCPNLTTCTTFT